VRLILTRSRSGSRLAAPLARAEKGWPGPAGSGRGSGRPEQVVSLASDL